MSDPTFVELWLSGGFDNKSWTCFAGYPVRCTILEAGVPHMESSSSFFFWVKKNLYPTFILGSTKMLGPVKFGLKKKLESNDKSRVQNSGLKLSLLQTMCQMKCLGSKQIEGKKHFMCWLSRKMVISIFFASCRPIFEHLSTVLFVNPISYGGLWKNDPQDYRWPPLFTLKSFYAVKIRMLTKN